jgi:ProP effector
VEFAAERPLEGTVRDALAVAVCRDAVEMTRSLNERARRRQRTLDTLAILAEWFPAAFTLHLPLKAGIHLDLRERAGAITNMELGEALKFHCNAVAYRLALKDGATRIDLDGQPAGVVTAEQAARAKAEIAEIRERRRQLQVQPVAQNSA